MYFSGIALDAALPADTAQQNRALKQIVLQQYLKITYLYEQAKPGTMTKTANATPAVVYNYKAIDVPPQQISRLYAEYDNMSDALQYIKQSYQKLLVVNRQQQEYIGKLTYYIGENIYERALLSAKINEYNVAITLLKQKTRDPAALLPRNPVNDVLVNNIAAFNDELAAQNAVRTYGHLFREVENEELKKQRKLNEILQGELYAKDAEIQKLRDEVVKVYQISNYSDIVKYELHCRELSQTINDMQQQNCVLKYNNSDLSNYLEALRQQLVYEQNKQHNAQNHEYIQDIIDAQLQSLAETHQDGLRQVQAECQQMYTENAYLQDVIGAYKYYNQKLKDELLLLGTKYADLIRKFDDYVRNASVRESNYEKTVSRLELKLYSKVYELLNLQQHLFKLKNQMRMEADRDIFMHVDDMKKIMAYQTYSTGRYFMEKKNNMFIRQAEERQRTNQYLFDEIEKVRYELSSLKNKHDSGIENDSSNPKRERGSSLSTDSEQRLEAYINEESPTNSLNLDEYPTQKEHDEYKISYKDTNSNQSVKETERLDEHPKTDEKLETSEEANRKSEYTNAECYGDDNAIYDEALADGYNAKGSLSTEIPRTHCKFAIHIANDHKRFYIVRYHDGSVLYENTQNSKELEYVPEMDTEDAIHNTFGIVVDDMYNELTVKEIPYECVLYFDGNYVEIRVSYFE